MKHLFLLLAAFVCSAACCPSELAADKTYSLSVVPTSVNSGTNATFTATFTNTSPEIASIHSISLTPPPNFMATSATSPSGSTVTIVSNTINVANLPAVTPGNSALITVDVTVAQEAVCGITQTTAWSSTAWTGNILSGSQFIFSGAPIVTTVITPGPTLTVTCPSNLTFGCADALQYPSVTVQGGCGTPTITFDHQAMDLQCGSNTVQVIVQDEALQTSACQFTATRDCEPLSLTCPAEVTFGCADALVYPIAQATGCGTVQLSYNPPATSLIGGVPTIVTVTALDEAGQTATCTFIATRLPLNFNGFLNPIGATGGSCETPAASLKLGKSVPIQFEVSCHGSPIASGSPVVLITQCSTGTPVTTGSCRMVDGRWKFNWDTRSVSQGVYQIRVTLQDGSQQVVFLMLR